VHEKHSPYSQKHWLEVVGSTLQKLLEDLNVEVNSVRDRHIYMYMYQYGLYISLFGVITNIFYPCFALVKSSTSIDYEWCTCIIYTYTCTCTCIYTWYMYSVCGRRGIQCIHVEFYCFPPRFFSLSTHGLSSGSCLRR
jgi:hypothetical protein